jgi:glycogen debranching enzyme
MKLLDLNDFIELKKPIDLCKSIVNICNNKNEINNLTATVLEKYVKSYMSRNLWTVKFLHNKLNILNNISTKHLHDNPLFRRIVRELSTFLCHLNEKEFKCKIDNNINEDRINTLFYNYINAPIIKDFLPYTAEDNCKYMGILKHCVKKGDTSGVITMLNYLLFNKELQAVSSDIDYIEISHIKKQFRDDIVWYLWKLLIKCSKSDLEREWIKTNIELYAMNLQKKYRIQRLPLLYYCYNVVAKNKSIKNDDNTNMLNVIKESDVFDKRPESTAVSESTPRQQRSSTKIVGDGHPTKRKDSNTVKEINTNLKSLDYLKCLDIHIEKEY